jgi:hypothetical protein
MDENHQNVANGRLTTTGNKLWLPPSFANNKAPITPAPKTKEINWGFADRTVFDWAILISQVLGAFAIPFVVTVIGLYATQQITQQQAQLSNAATEKQHQTDIQIATDQQQEVTLQTYLDRMSNLLLTNHLHESKPGDEVRNVARAITLTALQNLNSLRKGILLRFLYESGLVNVGNQIVDLDGVDLSGVDVSQFRGGHIIIYGIRGPVQPIGRATLTGGRA